MNRSSSRQRSERARSWLTRSGAALLVLAGLLAVTRGFYFLADAELAWISGGRGSGIAVQEAGLHAKHPWQSFRRFSAQLQSQVLFVSEQLTRDGQPVCIRALLTWRLPVEGVARRARLPDSDAELGRRLSSMVGAELRAEVSRRTLDEILGVSTAERAAGGSQQLAHRIRSRTRGVLIDEYGVELVDLRIFRVSVPESHRGQVFRREVSACQAAGRRRTQEATVAAAGLLEQAAIEAANVRADAAERVAAIQAEARAEAARILARAEALDPELAGLQRALDACRQALDEDTMLMLEGGAEFFDLFEQASRESGSRPATGASRPGP